MKTIMKIALIVSAIAFATVANAQITAQVTATGINPENGPGATEIVTTQEESLPDFVTVGSTMPYRTVTNNIGTWFTDAAAAWGFTPVITQRVRWRVGSNEFTDADNRDTIFVTWPAVPGEHTLTVENAILEDGTAVSCPNNPATQTKNVFVLPRPLVVADAAAITGHNIVLCPEATTHIVTFQGRGIGQLNVTFGVERRNADGPDGSWEIVNSEVVGNARTNPDWFATTDFATALAQYNDAGNNQEIEIELTGLEAGFMYRVNITGISDQISRKSFTGDYAYTDVNNVSATFVIVPATTATRIDHVSNEAGINP